MKGLLHPEALRDLPTVAAWLAHAESTRRIVKENYKDLADEELLNVAIQENVLVQLENLRTHPAVAACLSRGQLNVHGWMYKIDTGEVFSYQPDEAQFCPLREVPSVRERRRPRLAATSSI